MKRNRSKHINNNESNESSSNSEEEEDSGDEVFRNLTQNQNTNYNNTNKDKDNVSSFSLYDLFFFHSPTYIIPAKIIANKSNSNNLTFTFNPKK